MEYYAHINYESYCYLSELSVDQGNNRSTFNVNLSIGILIDTYSSLIEQSLG